MKTIPLNANTLDQIFKEQRVGCVYKIQSMPFMKVIVRAKWLSFYVHFNAYGVLFKKQLGRYPETDLETFRRVAEHYYYGVRNRQISHIRMKLDALFVDIFMPYAKQNKRTYKVDIARYRDYVHEPLGQLFLDEIRPFHIQKLLDGLPGHLKPATRNRIRSLIHKLLAVGVENQLLVSNPCSLVKPLRENNIVERFLSDNEVAAFEQVALTASRQGDLASAALLLALYTGARIGNVIRIRKADINIEQKQLRLPVTKSGKAQTIPLGQRAIEVIKVAMQLSSGAYLFSSQRIDGHISYPKEKFRAVCRLCGISVRGAEHQGRPGFDAAPVTIHSLRKTFASQVLSKTGNIYLCSSLLGHSDISVTKRYAFLNDRVPLDAVDDLFVRRNHGSEKPVS